MKNDSFKMSATMSYVGVEPFNLAMAKNYLATNAEYVFKCVVRNTSGKHGSIFYTDLRYTYSDGISDAKLVRMVDHFMGLFPRGAGLRGVGMIVRKFWMSCYVLKKHYSRTKSMRTPNVNGVAKAFSTAPVSLLFDFAKVTGKALKEIPEKDIFALAIKGWLNGDGEEVWLSDLGLAVRNAAEAYKADSERSNKILKEKRFKTVHDSMKDDVVEYVNAKLKTLDKNTSEKEIKVLKHVLDMVERENNN